jgi:hypothetical protein
MKEIFVSRSELICRQGWQPMPRLSSYPKNFLDTHLPIEIAYSSHYPIFDKLLDITEKIDWHLDLQSGRYFPRNYARKIEIRTERHGNAKYVWEVNRMQYLPRLALQYRCTKELSYLNNFCRIISSWIEENPYLNGVNWYSPIEASIRLLNWFICWEILQASLLIEESPEFKSFSEKHWIPLIYLHCHFVARYPSRYSSANNHTIAEASALYVASSFWQFQESKKWKRNAKKILETEILNQHSENGINKEQAAGYIQFVADFLLVAYLVGEKSGDHFSSFFKKRFEKILDYIQTLTEENGTYPRYGDEDDALLFFLDSEGPQKNLLALCSLLTKLFPKRGKQVSGYLPGIKNQLLFGQENGSQNKTPILWKGQATSKFYEADGHFFLKNADEQYKIFIHFNAAPLGLEPMAAHGHADALSFSLILNGSPVFIDPGTYCYHTEQEWRQYFISTLAHNTVCVNNQNQALNGGPTLWISSYFVKIEEVSSGPDLDTVVASHEAYGGSGIIHSRRMTLNKPARLINIEDRLINVKSQPVSYEIPLHMHPQTKIKKMGRNQYQLTTAKNDLLYVSTDTSLQTQIIKGQTNPILGWYSPAFYRKQACPVIYSTIESTESISISTQIKIGD